MRTTTRTLLAWAAAGGVATAALFGIGAAIITAVNDEPDMDACKTAMRQDFEEGMRESAAATAGGTGESTRPPECEGVDDETAQRLAEEVMSEALNG